MDPSSKPKPNDTESLKFLKQGSLSGPSKSVQALSVPERSESQTQTGSFATPSGFAGSSISFSRARSKSAWDISSINEDGEDDDGLDELAHKSMAAADAERKLYKARDRWETRVDFDISTLAAGVGLGNVWKLALVVFENGHGAFFLPYITCLLLLAVPLYFTEASLGQFSSSSAVKVWDMAPIFRGVGFSTMAVIACTAGFYGAITSVSFNYMTHSFLNPLPWSRCDTSYYAMEGRFLFKNFTCNKTEGIHYYNDSSYPTPKLKRLTIGSVELYFRYNALRASDNLDNGIGVPDIIASIELFGVWVMVFLTAMTGTKSMSRGAYMQTLFPFLILFLLFLKSFFYEGSTEGIIQFLTPQWDRLASTELWHDALNQAFFTMGNGFGVHMILNSYNPFRQQSYKETIMLTGVDTFITLTAGMTIAASVGAVAYNQNATVEDVLKGRRGAGLAFITYPQLLASFSASGLSQIYSVLFFGMLVALGVGTLAGHVISFMGCIFDLFPRLTSRKAYRVSATLVVCLLFYGSGLLFVTPGGSHLQNFILVYTTEIMVFVVIFYETLGIFYVYGSQNWVVDLRHMYNWEGTFARAFLVLYRVWGYVIPWIIFAFLAHITYFDLVLGEDRLITTHYKQFPYPQAFYYIGVGMASATAAITPLTAIIVLIRSKGVGFLERWSACTQPSEKWGPKNPAHKVDWIFYRMIVQGCSFTAGLHSSIATTRHRVRVEDVARFNRLIQASGESRNLQAVASFESFESHSHSSSLGSFS